jgi:hypothetical protein
MADKAHGIKSCAVNADVFSDGRPIDAYVASAAAEQGCTVPGSSDAAKFLVAEQILILLLPLTPSVNRLWNWSEP